MQRGLTVASLAFSFLEPQLWSHVPVEYPPAREIADRHYSRQTKGADGILPPGQRFLLWHQRIGSAVWGVCRNMDPVGRYRWRNCLFRNESTTLSSVLIREATRQTMILWARRYKELPPGEWFTTEVAVKETAGRRSKRHEPGHCYLMAGWIHVATIAPGHGRPERCILKAPSISELFAPSEDWPGIG